MTRRTRSATDLGLDNFRIRNSRHTHTAALPLNSAGCVGLAYSYVKAAAWGRCCCRQNDSTCVIGVLWWERRLRRGQCRLLGYLGTHFTNSNSSVLERPVASCRWRNMAQDAEPRVDRCLVSRDGNSLKADLCPDGNSGTGRAG